MKPVSFTLLIATIALSSCGVNSAMIVNQNLNNTQVHLGSNNFKVLNKVSGSAEASYVLLIGGINKRQLYENAYADMLNKANLPNSSKAIINVLTEEHAGGVPPFFIRRTITVSCNVVEFTK